MITQSLLKYQIELDLIQKFTDQTCRPLEIEDKIDLTLLINKQKGHIIL